MDHVNVTEEMQNRILENIHIYQPARKSVTARKRKWLSAAACLVILLTGLWVMP